MTDLRTAQTLVEQNDAAIVIQQEYRNALSFAYGCMTGVQRQVYRDFHMKVLVERFDTEYCHSNEVILPYGELKSAIKYIKDSLNEIDYAELKEHFQFNIHVVKDQHETIEETHTQV
ncbi:hypothetical protein VPFG_00192 [Vibrio phage nt-1]|uniref:Uncharacterized protein n=1 Tax=Vibrio phage nt-1 TaxID=115992 RepID=R9TJC0_9CAUD|nr:hypothetical protein VPFG_00192 [Vibrio phage nt-1]AGN30192.1 hypothetical protein VPFG_00192 [Vibrio phage nt-1]